MSKKSRRHFSAERKGVIVRRHLANRVPVSNLANGKIERWHGSIKRECIRPAALETLDQAVRKVTTYVEHYNHARLHGAIGYLTPADKLNGLAEVIFAERDRKLEEARARRQQRRIAKQVA